MEPAYWDGALQNNLQTLFNAIRRLVPILEVRGGGCLITISAGERVRQDANSAYAVAKAGMVAAARNLAKELYNKNIRVHALCPGIIWEPLPDEKLSQHRHSWNDSGTQLMWLMRHYGFAQTRQRGLQA